MCDAETDLNELSRLCRKLRVRSRVEELEKIEKKKSLEHSKNAEHSWLRSWLVDTKFDLLVKFYTVFVVALSTNRDDNLKQSPGYLHPKGQHRHVSPTPPTHQKNLLHSPRCQQENLGEEEKDMQAKSRNDIEYNDTNDGASLAKFRKKEVTIKIHCCADRPPPSIVHQPTTDLAYGTTKIQPQHCLAWLVDEKRLSSMKKDSGLFRNGPSLVNSPIFRSYAGRFLPLWIEPGGPKLYPHGEHLHQQTHRRRRWRRRRRSARMDELPHRYRYRAAWQH